MRSRMSKVLSTIAATTTLIATPARADDTPPGATQYALIAMVTLCALVTLVTFILWRKQPEGDTELVKSRDSQT